MITEVILPKLGQTMEEGTIVEWLKRQGDEVKRGDPLFTVESDKAVLEVEATTRGFLRKILVLEGQKVPVLSVVALITREADEALDGYPQAGVQTEQARSHKAAPAPPTAAPEVAQPQTGRIFASPRARRTARQRGVDLGLVTGTGPAGRIVEKDVLAYAAAQPKATPMAVKTAQALGVELAAVSGSGNRGRIMKADVEAIGRHDVARAKIQPTEDVPHVRTEAMTGLRRIIAERMAASHTQTARVTLVTEVDATDLVRVRERLKESVTEEWGFCPGYNDLLGLVVARALREFPYMNARLAQDGQSIERLPDINLGLAVDTERGLLVPVIRGADRKGLRAFGTEFRALVARAQAGKSLPDDLAGGTFTITNLGMYDVDAFTPIINLPEAAILGAGRIQAKAIVREEQIMIRRMWTLSLVFDHRLVDGAPAARFLQRIKQLAENPFLLLG